MHAYWTQTALLLNAHARAHAVALRSNRAPPAIDETLVSLLHPRARGWAPATPADPRLGAESRRPLGLVPFLSQAFPPPPALTSKVMADVLRCTVRQVGARLAVLDELSNAHSGATVVATLHGGDAVRAIEDVLDPNPNFRSAHSALKHLSKQGTLLPSPAHAAYLSESPDSQTSGLFESVLVNLVNVRGALVDGTWSDPVLGPNPEATAQLLTHVAAYATPNYNSILGVVQAAFRAMRLSENLSGVAGVLAVVEPLYLCPDFYPADFAPFELNRSCQGYMSHAGHHAHAFRLQLLSVVVESVSEAIYFEQCAEATNTGATTTAVKLAGALSRLVVLDPALAFERGALGAKLTEPEPINNYGLFLRLRIQSMLQRVIDADDAFEKEKKTPAWMWDAIGRAAGTSPVPARADADASLAVGAAGVHTAVDAQCVKVRAHLLRVLAGPVTELSATSEGIALALAKPTRAVHAAIILARFDRAFRAVGRPLAPRDQLEALLLQVFPLHNDLDTSASQNVSQVEEDVPEDENWQSQHDEGVGEDLD